jgi:hypothetical protein
MSQSPETCTFNLGPRETRKRLVFGIVFLVIGLVASWVFPLLDLNAAVRLVLFVPFWFGFLGLLEARTRT